VHVILVEPAFPLNQRQFARALREAGAHVTAIGERPYDWLDGELKGWLHGYEQVRSVCDEGAMMAAVKKIQSRGWVDRIEATIEAHILTTARVREAAGIPGLTYEQAWICRDKPTMKEYLRKRGIPCARSTPAEALDVAWDFAHEVGYPLIIKPRAGAGADGTYKVTNDQEYRETLEKCNVGRGGSVAIEEFIEGHEGFYDTITVNGQPQIELLTHYYPSVLPAMRDRNIAPQIAVTNRLSSPGYGEVYELGRKVISALGLQTSPTHMEWFYGPRGLKFSEIGARPPGVRQWDLYNVAHDIDLYRQWAMALVHGRVDQRPSCRFATGLVNLRPNKDGRIAGYSGVDEVKERWGHYIIDHYFPAPGTPTQPVEAGYMANAWIRLKHPDYDQLRELLAIVGRTIKVWAN
jgi:Carbamoyl-phosphate synthase L chain, ATP binding domain